MITLEGKTAIITGAGRGIGAGIARSFATLGAVVNLVDLDDAALGDRVMELASDGLDACPYAGDVQDKSFLLKVVDDVCDRHGGVDILVNNAGIIRDNLLERISERDWDAVLDTNLKGAFLCAQAVVPRMRERRYGKMINIVSSSWLGNIGQTNYAASKGGLVSLTRTLALELARDRINVNGVAPGLIDTPMTRGLPEKVRQRLIRKQPGGDMGTIEDVASAVCFLASDQSRFITGQILHVDGGKSCGLLSL